MEALRGHNKVLLRLVVHLQDAVREASRRVDHGTCLDLKLLALQAK